MTDRNALTVEVYSFKETWLVVDLLKILVKRSSQCKRAYRPKIKLLMRNVRNIQILLLTTSVRHAIFQSALTVQYSGILLIIIRYKKSTKSIRKMLIN